MKTLSRISLKAPIQMELFAVMLAGLLTLPPCTKAIEDPPGCSEAHGGLGGDHTSGLTFGIAQAHVGDDVPLLPTTGKVAGSCRAEHVTGSLYLASSNAITFLDNAPLEPGITVRPTLRVHITSDFVGAGVNSPHGNVPGLPKTVRAIAIVEGTALTGPASESFQSLHSASVNIVTPALQVFERPAYPAGQTCFPAGGPVQYSGYVTNSGDITMTNVTVMDDRSGRLQLLDPTNGFPIPGNVTLAPGAIAKFAGSFTPTPGEIIAGSAANQLTATARDITPIGGPNSAPTNSLTTASAVCGVSPEPSLVNCVRLPDGRFQFDVVGQAGKTYQIQSNSDLNSSEWVAIGIVRESSTFTDSSAPSYSVQFYRAVELR